MARPVYHVVWDLSRDNIRTDTLLQNGLLRLRAIRL